MHEAIVVKQSKIHNKGVFAARDFKKGEVVLRWRNPKELRKSEVEKLKKAQKHYLSKVGNKYFLSQPPERYVNHSCEANTRTRGFSDVAVRDIHKGEEITSDYHRDGVFIAFTCRCGSKKCRGIID